MRFHAFFIRKALEVVLLIFFSAFLSSAVNATPDLTEIFSQQLSGRRSNKQLVNFSLKIPTEEYNEIKKQLDPEILHFYKDYTILPDVLENISEQEKELETNSNRTSKLKKLQKLQELQELREFFKKEYSDTHLSDEEKQRNRTLRNLEKNLGEEDGFYALQQALSTGNKKAKKASLKKSFGQPLINLTIKTIFESCKKLAPNTAINTGITIGKEKFTRSIDNTNQLTYFLQHFDEKEKKRISHANSLPNITKAFWRFRRLAGHVREAAFKKIPCLGV